MIFSALYNILYVCSDFAIHIIHGLADLLYINLNKHHLIKSKGRFQFKSATP